MSYIYICTYHSTYIVYIYIWCIYHGYIVCFFYIYAYHICICTYPFIYIYICIICTNCTYYVPCHVYQDRYHKYDKNCRRRKKGRFMCVQSHRQHPWNQGFAAKMFTSCPQTVHHQASSLRLFARLTSKRIRCFLELIYFRWAPGIQL